MKFFLVYFAVLAFAAIQALAAPLATNGEEHQHQRAKRQITLAVSDDHPFAHKSNSFSGRIAKAPAYTTSPQPSSGRGVKTEDGRFIGGLLGGGGGGGGAVGGGLNFGLNAGVGAQGAAGGAGGLGGILG